MNTSDLQANVATENFSNKERVSAADYDPSMDRREDEQKRVNAPVDAKADVISVELEDGDEIAEEIEEDDLDDMFALLNEDKPKKIKKVKKSAPAAPVLINTALDAQDDPEGYYDVRLGELLDGDRYKVISLLGKGMFANVIRAQVQKGDHSDTPDREVAIKIIRRQESMYKAGLKEVQLLMKLKAKDPDDKRHVIRLERTFEHRGHLCLVFENMSMNLREVLKRFGKDVGLNIAAVRAYANQLFQALHYFRAHKVMHADIKPDNILVNQSKTVIKVCDLGSASDASENEITPYLVSRFYRAPEIILGAPYDSSIDTWSVGCTLFELFTGQILFPGRSNNQMLLLMQQLKGKLNTRLIKKGKFGDLYFDDMGAFESLERDAVMKTDVVRKVHLPNNATKDLRSRLAPYTSTRMKDDERKRIDDFTDLLDKCLALDPTKRIQPRDALKHPFITGV